MQVEQVERVFEYNGVKLPDIAGHEPDQIKTIYAASYPELLNAVIEGPEQRGNKLVYTFRKSAGTKA